MERIAFAADEHGAGTGALDRTPDAPEGPGAARNVFHDLSPAKRLQRALLRALAEVAPRYALRLAYHHFTRPRRRSGYRAEALPAGAVPFVLPFGRSYLQGYMWGAGRATVYLVHGWESHLGRMTRFVEPLVAAGFRVVAFDAPGHGRSGPQATHIGDVRAALEAVVARFGPPHAFVAHSYGAAATALLLRERPDLRPAALALVAPMTSLRIHLDTFGRVARLPSPVLSMLAARLEDRLGMAIGDADVAANVRDLRARGLLVHDRRDDVVPFAAAARVAAVWRGAEFRVTAGLGHRSILRDADVVGRVAAFVAGDAGDRDAPTSRRSDRGRSEPEVLRRPRAPLTPAPPPSAAPRLPPALHGSAVRGGRR